MNTLLPFTCNLIKQKVLSFIERCQFINSFAVVEKALGVFVSDEKYKKYTIWASKEMIDSVNIIFLFSQ